MQVPVGAAAVVVVVVGHTAVVVVAVEALAGQSSAGIADNHWQLSEQTPAGRALISTRHRSEEDAREKMEIIEGVAPQGHFPRICYCIRQIMEGEGYGS